MGGELRSSSRLEPRSPTLRLRAPVPPIRGREGAQSVLAIASHLLGDDAPAVVEAHLLVLRPCLSAVGWPAAGDVEGLAVGPWARR